MVLKPLSELDVICVQLLDLQLHLEELIVVLLCHLLQFLREVLLLRLDLIFKELDPGYELALCLDRLTLTVPDGVLLKLLVFEILPAAVVRTHEVDSLIQFRCFALEEIFLAENTLEISIKHAPLADVWVLCPVCTVRTCKCFADAALSRLDCEILAHYAYKEVNLIRIRSAKSKQFWLQLLHVTI